MATFLLIRHAENDFVGKKLAGRLPGVHLNKHGVQQTNRLAKELSKLPVNAIYASPLERAQETAVPLASKLNLGIQTDPALIEIDFGAWEGQDLNQLRESPMWQSVQEEPDTFQFPDGESLREAQARITEGLTRLSNKHGENDLVLCISHSDPLRLAVVYFLGLPLNTLQRIRIKPASVTALTLADSKKPYFGFINQTFGRLRLPQ